MSYTICAVILKKDINVKDLSGLEKSLIKAGKEGGLKPLSGGRRNYCLTYDLQNNRFGRLLLNYEITFTEERSDCPEKNFTVTWIPDDPCGLSIGSAAKPRAVKQVIGNFLNILSRYL